jgi:hypothetical protein
MPKNSSVADAQLRIRARIELRISLIGVIAALVAGVGDGIDRLRGSDADHGAWLVWLSLFFLFAGNAYTAYRTMRRLR